MGSKTPRPGFRKRINPWYQNMTRRQIMWERAKTTARWLAVTVAAYFYWFFLLLLLSIFLVNIWHITIVQILIWAAVLCGITSVVYGYMLYHRKHYY